jgi:hypothetical protein
LGVVGSDENERNELNQFLDFMLQFLPPKFVKVNYTSNEELNTFVTGPKYNEDNRFCFALHFDEYN